MNNQHDELAGQVTREKIINAELVIERDNIKRQRDELAALLRQIASTTTASNYTLREIARAALAKVQP